MTGNVQGGRNAKKDNVWVLAQEHQCGFPTVGMDW